MTARRSLHVALALVWKDGRLLVTRRPEGTHLAGSWEFPGGKLEPGETPERCAEREVLEEVGIHCHASAVRAPVEHEYEDRAVRLYPVDCEWLSGEPRALEVRSFAWVAPNELALFEFPAANARLLEQLALEAERGVRR